MFIKRQQKTFRTVDLYIQIFDRFRTRIGYLQRRKQRYAVKIIGITVKLLCSDT